MDEAPSPTPGAWRRVLGRIRTLARRVLPFVSGVLAVLVALLLYNQLVPSPHQIDTQDVRNAIVEAMASATPPPPFSVTAYQSILPSLVLVEALPPGADSNISNPNGDLAVFDDGEMLTTFRYTADGAIGSGVIVDDSGDILTSLHPLANAAQIRVTFADGTQSSAQVIGTQPENDIAALRADKPPSLLVPAILGNPNAMQVGDEAYIVGHPFGMTNSMSAGVISGFERSFQLPNSDLTIQHLIQVDAAVNPGNSGGPLINRYGQVIGIVVGLLNPTDQGVFVGIGFAVPITTAGGAAGAPPV